MVSQLTTYTFLLVLSLTTSDLVFEFGYKRSEFDFPACYVRDIVEDEPQKQTVANFTCKVTKWKFISGVDVRLMGPAEMVGGAKLEKRLGKQNVTIRVWNSKSQSLDYEIFVYGDCVGNEDPVVLEGHVVKKKE